MALHSMGRKGGNSMAEGGGGGASSIALHYEPPARLLVHPEMIFHKPTTTTTTTRPCFQDSLSLGLNLYTKQAEPQPAKTPPLMDFWSVDSTSVSTMCAHDKPEVDTSLHL